MAADMVVTMEEEIMAAVMEEAILAVVTAEEAISRGQIILRRKSFEIAAAVQVISKPQG